MSNPHFEEKVEEVVEEAAEKAGGLLRSRFGLWALAGISFTESALPTPFVADPFLAAYILANRNRQAAWRGLVVAVFTAVLGAVFTYTLAFLFYDAMIEQYLNGAFAEEFARVSKEFDKGTFVITLVAILTPIPDTLIATAAGLLKANIFVFIAAAFVARCLRYGAVAWLTYQYGQQALDMAKNHLWWATAICFALAFIYFLYFIN